MMSSFFRYFGFCQPQTPSDIVVIAPINELSSQKEEKIYIYKKLDIAYLENITYKTTIPFIPPIFYGKVVKVYDGDTITIASKLPYVDSPIYRFSVRLRNIDSPEIKGKSSNEKKLAIISRDALSKLIFHKIVRIDNNGTEKYGRLLADVYLEDIHINDWMLKHTYAISYDGGTKQRPNEWND